MATRTFLSPSDTPTSDRPTLEQVGSAILETIQGQRAAVAAHDLDLLTRLSTRRTDLQTVFVAMCSQMTPIQQSQIGNTKTPMLSAALKTALYDADQCYLTELGKAVEVLRHRLLDTNKWQRMAHGYGHTAGPRRPAFLNKNT